MKRALIYSLIVVNLLLGLIIVHIFLPTKLLPNNQHDIPSLKRLTSVSIINNSNQQTIKFIKSQRTKQWMLSSSTFEWPANNSALEHLLTTIRLDGTINRDDIISIVACDGKNTWKFNTNISSKNDNNWEYAILKNCLNNQIVLDTLHNCKIFKIDHENKEFIFTKYGTQWYLASPESDMIVEKQNIDTFFQTLLHTHADKIFAIKQFPMRPNLSIKLYNDTNSQTISFLSIDDKIYTTNNRANIGFSITPNEWNNIQQSVQNILTFNILPNISCHDIDITLTNSHEQFTFHDIQEHNRCQFTHIKNGILNVYELQQQTMRDLVDFLKTITSLSITTLSEKNTPSFVITINSNDPDKAILSFYAIDNKLFVTINHHPAAFEIPAHITPVLFHKVRSNIVAPGNLL